MTLPNVTGRDTLILTQALHYFATHEGHTSNGGDALTILKAHYPEMLDFWEEDTARRREHLKNQTDEG